MDTIFLIRLAITLTFLILACGGPYAIIELRRFIRRYTVKHEELKTDVKNQDTRIQALEEWRASQEQSR